MDVLASPTEADEERTFDVDVPKLIRLAPLVSRALLRLG